MSGQAPTALAAWRYRTDENSISDFITSYPDAQLGNYANWFVSNHQSGLNRIFPAHDVQVRSTDSGQRHAYYGLTYVCTGHRYFFYADIILTVKNVGFHFHTSPFQNG